MNHLLFRKPSLIAHHRSCWRLPSGTFDARISSWWTDVRYRPELNLRSDADSLIGFCISSHEPNVRLFGERIGERIRRENRRENKRVTYIAMYSSAYHMPTRIFLAKLKKLESILIRRFWIDRYRLINLICLHHTYIHTLPCPLSLLNPK